MLDDVLGVAVVLGEDQRLRHLGRGPGKISVQQLVAERADDGADLVGRDDVAVELVGVVVEVVVELLPARRARVARSRYAERSSRPPPWPPASVISVRIR